MYKTKKFQDAVNCSLDVPFSQISNDVIHDGRISCKALGILTIMLSNKIGWTSYKNKLKEGTGREQEVAISNGLTELEDHGYFLNLSLRDNTKRYIVGSFWAYTQTPGLFNLKTQAIMAENEGLVIEASPYKKEKYDISDMLDLEFLKNNILDIREKAMFMKHKHCSSTANNTKDNNTKISSKEDTISPSGDTPISEAKQKFLNNLAKKAAREKAKKQVLSKPIVKVPVKKQYDSPEHIWPVILLWEKYGGMSHEMTSKTFRDMVDCIRKLMNGTFAISKYPEIKGHKFTLDDFEFAFKNYQTAKTDLSVYPKNKRALHIPFATYIYNPFNDSSFFAEHAAHEPVKIVQLVKKQSFKYNDDLNALLKINSSISLQFEDKIREFLTFAIEYLFSQEEYRDHRSTLSFGYFIFPRNRARLFHDFLHTYFLNENKPLSDLMSPWNQKLFKDYLLQTALIPEKCPKNDLTYLREQKRKLIERGDIKY